MKRKGVQHFFSYVEMIGVILLFSLLFSFSLFTIRQDSFQKESLRFLQLIKRTQQIALLERINTFITVRQITEESFLQVTILKMGREEQHTFPLKIQAREDQGKKTIYYWNILVETDWKIEGDIEREFLLMGFGDASFKKSSFSFCIPSVPSFFFYPTLVDSLFSGQESLFLN